MKFYNHLLAYTLVALATLCSQPLSAQLRLSTIITDVDTTHYTYDAKGQITKIVSGGHTYHVKHIANEIYVTPADSSDEATFIYNDPETHLTKGIEKYFLLSEEEFKKLENKEWREEDEPDFTFFEYDSIGQLNDYISEVPDGRVVFQNNRLFSIFPVCDSLTYPTTPLPADIQACIKAIPNFSLFLPFYLNADSLSSSCNFLGCFFPVANFGASLDDAPISGKTRLWLPYDELETPDQDSPVNPFIDLVDARSPRLMDIEAVRPSMLVEQAVSEAQEREEMWLTLQQYDDFMAYVEQINAAYEDMPDMDLDKFTGKDTNLRFTYTLTKTAEGQRALRVEITPEDTTKLLPTDIDIVYHKTITFVFE